MISIWRSNRLRPSCVGGLVGLPAVKFGWYLLCGLAGAAILPGCAWVRAQAQHQSEECEKLCSQAEVAKDAGRMDRADVLLNAALKKSPRDMEVQRQLADSLWDVGRQQESLMLLAQLAEQHPRDVRLATSLAERLTELERYDEALERLLPALAADPSAATTLELKARIEISQGNTDAALATYQRLGQQEASQAQALLEMGSIYLSRGQSDRAAPLFRSVLSHPRATAEQQQSAHWQLGVAYAQGRRWSDAAAQLAHVAPEREMSVEDWHAVAYAQYRSGDLPAAASALNHALGLEPSHRESLKLSRIVGQEMVQRPKSSADLQPTVFERVADPGVNPPR